MAPGDDSVLGYLLILNLGDPFPVNKCKIQPDHGQK